MLSSARLAFFCVAPLQCASRGAERGGLGFQNTVQCRVHSTRFWRKNRRRARSSRKHLSAPLVFWFILPNGFHSPCRLFFVCIGAAWFHAILYREVSPQSRAFSFVMRFFFFYSSKRDSCSVWRTLDTLKNNRVRYWEFTRDGRAVSHLKFYKVWHLRGIPSSKPSECNFPNTFDIQHAYTSVSAQPLQILALIIPKASVVWHLALMHHQH